jgi:hypothetical protein
MTLRSTHRSTRSRSAEIVGHELPKASVMINRNGRSPSPKYAARVMETLRHIDADCNYEMYRTVIWGIESLGWNCGEEIQRSWSKTAPHRFEETTLQNLKNSFALGEGMITFGSVVYLGRSAREAA